MHFVSNLRSRQRLLFLYVGITSAAAIVLACALPGQAIGIGCMAVVGVGSAWLVARLGVGQLRRRLHALREVTDSLSRGALIEHMESLPNDDFVKLAESVDRLAAQVRRMVEEQEQLRQRLTRSEKLAVIGELAATVAHEVNNPLDGLQNSIRIIRRRAGGDAQTRELLVMMEQGLARIEKTVRRLLSMSRDEPIQPVPTHAEDIVDDAVMFVQPRLNRYGIRLVRDFSLEPVVVDADGVHMAQVLINLMINAADAMKETGGQLTVRCRPADVPAKAWLEVIDTGCGIEARHLPHIFEPFYSTKGKGAGTGLGLSVVARVVEAHHGRIEVRTAPGEGTCFCLELPAVVPVQEDPLLQAKREEASVHGARAVRVALSSDSI
jgi:signal transduction histidine kinase